MLTQVRGIEVGHFTDRDAGTGCTVVVCREGAVGGVDVRGAAPGTRETDLLRPGHLVERVHAVVLTGGSAYGLSTADGVMRWLEERHFGFSMGANVVPIVCAAVIFDLGFRAGIQSSDNDKSRKPGSKRPNAESGYQACAALTFN